MKPETLPEVTALAVEVCQRMNLTTEETQAVINALPSNLKHAADCYRAILASYEPAVCRVSRAGIGSGPHQCKRTWPQ